jgi:hypothetical protein
MWAAEFPIRSDVRTYIHTDRQAITVRNINFVSVWHLVNLCPWKILFFALIPYRFARIPIADRDTVSQSLSARLRSVLSGDSGLSAGGRKRSPTSWNCPHRLWSSRSVPSRGHGGGGAFFWGKVAGAESWQLTCFMYRISSPDSSVGHELTTSVYRMRCQCWFNAAKI